MGSVIYTLKSQQEKSKGWKSKNLWCLLLLSKAKYGRAHTIFRSVFKVHIQEIGLCCNVALGHWCIGSSRSSRHYKFEQRKSGKSKILPNTLWRQIRWSAFNFLYNNFKFITIACNMFFSIWCIIFIKNSTNTTQKVKVKKYYGFIGVPLELRTLLLLNLKKLWRYSIIFLEAICVCCTRSTHRSEFEQRKFRKKEDFK